MRRSDSSHKNGKRVALDRITSRGRVRKLKRRYRGLSLLDYITLPYKMDDQSYQLKTITSLEKFPSSLCCVGQVRYLISKFWWTKWILWSSKKADHPPGPIDFSPYVSKKSSERVVCKKGIAESYQFISVSELQWEKLYEWYGALHVVKRKVIARPETGTLIIDIWPVDL